MHEEFTMKERKATAGSWRPGQSGNPAGKKPGTRHHATRLVMELMEGGIKDITKKVIEAAKGGDLVAARLVLDRLAPPMRERSIELDLPDTGTANGIAEAQQTVLEAVGQGELTPGEGQVLAGILEARRKALETEELERRIAALEGKQ
jgi:hypothetical protein